MSNTVNQCDGCAQNAPLRNGLHYDQAGRSFMSCQRERYETAQTEAYVSGRKDEREEWAVVLEALKRCIGSLRTVSPGGDGDPDVEFARAAISHIEGKS